MDILYLYKDDGLNGESLKYSLRSVDKFGKGVDRIFLCGDKPDWIENVIYIQYNIDNSISKNKNMWSQILYAVKNSDIGINDNGEFLISMDDHFYCKMVDFNNYPFYVKDYTKRANRYILPMFLDCSKTSIDYQQLLINTYHFCIKHQLPPFIFAIHRNMHANRNIINEMEDINNEIINGELDVEGIAIMLNYRLRYYPFKFEIVDDPKSNSVKKIIKTIKRHHVFSLNDYEHGSDEHILLKSLYQNKSKYEK